MNVDVRISTHDNPAAPSELAAIKSLFDNVLDELHGDNVAARNHYANQYTIERLNLMAKEATAITLIVSINQQVLGFGLGRVSGGVGFLHWMGLDPAVRNSGIGEQLLEAFMDEFRRRHCHKVELYTYQDRPFLEDFYRKAGFQVTARLEDHYFHLNVTYMTVHL